MTSETDPAPQPPRRRWRRRLLWTAAVLLLLVLVAPLAVSLPPVRSMLADRIGEALDRDVTIGSAFAYWGHGLDLDDVTVSGPEGFDAPLATVPHVHVDVAVFSLIGGTVDAEVLVERPHVTIERGEGRSNLDGLGGPPKEKRAAEETEAEREAREREPSDARVKVTVVGGVVEARGLGGETQGLDDVGLTFELSPGRRALDLDALARAAGVDGGDAPIAVAVAQVAGGEGPFEVAIPPLALARLSALVEGATGTRLLGGTLALTANGKTIGMDAIQGDVALDAAGVHAVLANGTVVRADKVDGDAKIDRGDAKRAIGRVSLEVAPLVVEGPSSLGGRRVEEPEVKVDADGVFDPQAQTLRLASGSVDAGKTLGAKLTTPWDIAFEPLTAVGDAQVTADLERVGTFGALFPALSRLRDGTCVVNVRGFGTERLGFSASAAAEGVVLDPLEPDGLPYTEPRVVLQARWTETDDDASRLDLYTLKSRLATTTHTSTSEPFVVYVSGGDVRMDGRVGLETDLEAVSQLAPGYLLLKPGERMTGTVSVDGHASGDASKMEASATLSGTGISAPARLGGRRGDGALTAKLRLDTAGDVMHVVFEELKGLGIASGRGNLRLDDGAPYWVTDGVAVVTGDLDWAHRVVYAWLETELPAQLGGRFTIDLKTRPSDGGLALDGRTTVENMVWQDTPEDLPVRDPRVAIEHKVWLAPGDERHRADRLVAALSGLAADLSGSSIATGADDVDMDVRAALTGDAARLAPALAAWLGTDFADLRGQGPISGSASIRGNPSGAGRDLLVDGSVKLGSWNTAGLAFSEARVTARRDAFEHPFDVALETGLNGGTANVGFSVDLGNDARPWTLATRLKQVDTADVLVDHGFGKYLAFAVPALLPVDSKVPVLSGKLDADIDLHADAFESPALEDTLAGTATISMCEGSIKDSSLFRGGGKEALGDAGKVLFRLVPDADKALARVSEAIAFSSLESKIVIGERKVTIEEAALVGPHAVIGMLGTAGFDERLDLDTRVQLQDKAGKQLAKFLPEGVIPFRVKGTLEKPKPRADIDASKLASGGLLDDLLGGGDKKKKDPLKRLRDLIK